jgi:hypothetical protein
VDPPAAGSSAPDWRDDERGPDLAYVVAAALAFADEGELGDPRDYAAQAQAVVEALSPTLPPVEALDEIADLAKFLTQPNHARLVRMTGRRIFSLATQHRRQGKATG